MALALTGASTEPEGRQLRDGPGRSAPHVTPIKQLLRIALEAPPVALYRIHLDLTCLNEIDWYADGPAVVRSMNDTAHVPLPPEAAAGVSS